MADFNALNHKQQHNVAMAYIDSLASESLFADVDVESVDPKYHADMLEFIEGKKKLRTLLALAQGKQ